MKILVESQRSWPNILQCHCVSVKQESQILVSISCFQIWRNGWVKKWFGPNDEITEKQTTNEEMLRNKTFLCRKISVLLIHPRTRENSTYQNSVECRRITAPLYVPQYSYSGILLQSIHDDLFDLFSRNRIPISIDCTFSDDDYIKSLSNFSFLKLYDKIWQELFKRYCVWHWQF